MHLGYLMTNHLLYNLEKNLGLFKKNILRLSAYFNFFFKICYALLVCLQSISIWVAVQSNGVKAFMNHISLIDTLYYRHRETDVKFMDSWNPLLCSSVLYRHVTYVYCYCCAIFSPFFFLQILECSHCIIVQWLTHCKIMHSIRFVVSKQLFWRWYLARNLRGKIFFEIIQSRAPFK